MAGDTPDFVSMLRELVAAPSVSSTRPELDTGNREVTEKLADWLLDLGFSIELLDVPDRPEKVNLIATLGHGSGGLVFSGHTDTVPCNPARWTSDPFTLDERDDRLYGLGTADMKGFFPLAIEALRPYVGRQLREPLIIVATADEESSMHGARALADAGKPRARYAVIGEPTGLVPIRMHKGIMMERVSIQGRSGHSSDPALGCNALECMHAVIAELLACRDQLQDEFRNDAFAVPTPTLNLGSLHGGDNPNRICGAAELEYDLRTLPEMQIPVVRDRLRSRTREAALKFGAEIETAALFNGIEAFELPAASDLVATCEQLTGEAARAVAFATEAPYFAQLGMETIVLGPGNIEQAHQPDEYLAMERVNPTIRILRGLIERYCIGDAPELPPDAAGT